MSVAFDVASGSSLSSAASTDASTVPSPALSPHSTAGAASSRLQLRVLSPSSSPSSLPSPSSSALSSDSPHSAASGGNSGTAGPGSTAGRQKESRLAGAVAVGVKREKAVADGGEDGDAEEDIARKRLRPWEPQVRAQPTLPP